MTVTTAGGSTLAEAVAAGGLDLTAIVGQLPALAGELEQIHASGHVHGQVCLENVLMHGDGRLTLAPADGLPRIGSIVYDVVPERAAPEQLQRFGAAPSMDWFLFARMIQGLLAGVGQEVPDVLGFAGDPSVPPRLRISPLDLVAEVRRGLSGLPEVRAQVGPTAVGAAEHDWQRALDLAARGAFGPVDQCSPPRPRDPLQVQVEPTSDLDQDPAPRWWRRRAI